MERPSTDQDHQTVIAAYVLTKDEEERIDRAVRSLRRVTDHVLVLDSCSSDATADIATRAGGVVETRPFDGYASQRNWAISRVTALFDPQWILTIDADEWLDESIVEEVNGRVQSGTLDADVYLIRRRVRFDGRVLRHGGWGRTWLPRLFRAAGAHYEDREVNEHLAIDGTSTVDRLEGTIEHEDVQSWESYIDKHNRYSTLEARARLRAGAGERVSLRTALRHRHLRRRWLRQNVFDRLPGRPALRFLQLYVVGGGFLDRRPGFRRALFEAWQEMCVDLKAEALARGRSER